MRHHERTPPPTESTRATQRSELVGRIRTLPADASIGQIRYTQLPRLLDDHRNNGNCYSKKVVLRPSESLFAYRFCTGKSSAQPPQRNARGKSLTKSCSAIGPCPGDRPRVVRGRSVSSLDDPDMPHSWTRFNSRWSTPWPDTATRLDPTSTFEAEPYHLGQTQKIHTTGELRSHEWIRRSHSRLSCGSTMRAVGCS